MSFAASFFLERFGKHLSMFAPAIAGCGLQRAVFFATQAGNRAAADWSAKTRTRAGVPSVSCYGGALGHPVEDRAHVDARRSIGVAALRLGVPALRLGVPTRHRTCPAGATTRDPDPCNARRGAGADRWQSWRRSGGTA